KTLRDEAEKNYRESIVSLTRASLLRPNDPQTLRNLGSVYVFMGEYQQAVSVFNAALVAVPGDSSLVAGLKNARVNYANQLLEEKNYDQATAFYNDLLK